MMKKYILLLSLSVLTLSLAFAQPHFVPVTDPSASLFPGQVYVYNAMVGDDYMVAGDEIGVFDGDLCVGALVLTSPIIDTMTPIVYAVYAGPSDLGAITGHFIYLRIWDSSAQVEYAYPEMSVQFAMPPTFPADPEWITTFANGGTTHVEMISYETPTGINTQPIYTLEEDFYIIEGISFPGTGVTLDRARILGVPDTEFDMTVYAFDEISTDTYYEAIADDTTPPLLGGTVPVPNLTPYGWFIDSGDLDVRPNTSNPTTITFNLNDILPDGYTMDPVSVGIYRRDIHGTSYFVPVTSVNYDLATNSITITLNSGAMLPAEFILTGIIEEPPLPVELSSFSAVMSNTNAAVNLMWVSQTESGMLGYRIYKGLNDVLAEALDQNTLIPATNTSQPTTYLYADTDIVSETQYHYWLEAVDMDGTSQIFGPIYIVTPASTYNTPEIPLVTGLNSLYPNPFNPDLTINYSVDRTYPVEIFITNMRGQRIRTLVRETRDKGTYTYTWNGRDEQGRQCSSGVYYVKMIAGKEEFNRKAILMK